MQCLCMKTAQHAIRSDLSGWRMAERVVNFAEKWSRRVRSDLIFCAHFSFRLTSPVGMFYIWGDGADIEQVSANRKCKRGFFFRQAYTERTKKNGPRTRRKKPTSYAKHINWIIIADPIVSSTEQWIPLARCARDVSIRVR